ncbi:AAA family ATPase [Vibrio parahaemolyticus]|nr:AAA domain-containing protein [Vibrio parahaemolyticus]EHH2455693.1 AAA domain-containing protein [Vibrio parahaemolyticus]EJG0654708.1 AAA family ATPase [Vibrio parahaemolyticus]EJG0771804.1 AAA family ATPase [Vibrio parahaemolyticus]EJG0804478.1 AAA family ATPase [Vibrio parahaemolyticus]
MSLDSKTIVSLLKKHKNILLYGPPGTGKTHTLSQIVKSLKQEKTTSPTVVFDSPDSLFGSVESGSSVLEINNAEVEWITFHQNYSYQDFILGKRPKPSDQGMVLEPYFGKLMDSIITAQESKPVKDVVIIIDEINRANVSKVFGEFITFLDSQYRETLGGVPNEDAVSIDLAGIEYTDGVSEPIKSLKTGQFIQIPRKWKFPENVYLIATMNSVDKAAMPIDAAMLRRFHQIEFKPDVLSLATKFGFDLAELEKLVDDIQNDRATVDNLSATNAATLLLDRVNWYISNELGTDFEIGHSVFWDIRVDEEQGWSDLIDSWDNKLLPLLKSRLIRAQGVLSTILKVDESSVTRVAFHYRKVLNSSLQGEFSGPIVCKPLGSLSLEDAKKILLELAL